MSLLCAKITWGGIFLMADRGEAGNGAELAPNYLRLSQAERERAARENREKGV